MKLSVVILAAGEGKRMYTQQPKVIQPIAGIPMLTHVLEKTRHLAAHQVCIVHGYRGEVLKELYKESDLNIVWAEQRERLGTGHAVLQAISSIPKDHYVLVLYGDVPLITEKTLVRLLNTTLAQDAGLGLLLASVPEPFGLGRIIRDDENNIQKIIEEKDANVSQKKIQEIFTGTLVARADLLHQCLPALSNNNAKNEYYLTDLIAMAAKNKIKIDSETVEDQTEILGANTRQQLAVLERAYQIRLADKLMTEGVTLKDPNRIDIRGNIKTGFDVIIDINNVFEGKVQLGDNVVIEPNCIIKNSIIGDHVRIKANTIIDGATIGRSVTVGPFARIRPGTILEDESRVGNFVEIKKTILGEGARVDHLSYLGDAIVGKSVNVGAGVITCNYDGYQKHQTIISDAVSIGANTQLVAPVKIGPGVTIGAGSTITKNVLAGGLVLSRIDQIHYPDWQSPLTLAKDEKLNQIG